MNSTLSKPPIFQPLSPPPPPPFLKKKTVPCRRMQRISSIRFLGYLELVFRANNMSAKQSEQNSAG